VVAEFQKLFLETWQTQKGEPLEPRGSFAAAATGRDGRACHRQLADDAFSLIYVRCSRDQQPETRCC